MKTNQWIQDVQKIIGCEAPELLCVLAKIATENNSRGLFARKCESKILECMEDVKLFLGEIRRNAQDFTLHDIAHCINVIDFMGQMLVGVKKINPAEISFFIYSALLHDIGMVKLPKENITMNDLREDHGDRSARFIRERVLVNNNGTPFNFGDYDYIYMEYLPSICASHMKEFSFVEKLPQNYILDGMEVDMSLCAILLRIADAMDLKRNRAPYQLYQFLINRSVSPDHWKKHMSISNCQVKENGVYRVDGICHDEAAHRCLYNHLDSIESEIEKVFKWKNGFHPKLRLRSHLVYRNIETDGYKMWHHSFNMDVLKITNLFMGEQLYGDKKWGLREIIQNSIDACMVRDELNKYLGGKQDYTYKPEIYIIFGWESNQIIIRDNGTGMNDYIIQNYFLNIGASYYSSNDFKKKNLNYSPSGYFGIGFLSLFMLSDDVYVRTAHWEEDVEYEFHFIKNDKFVTKTERSKTFSGTEIRLNLNQFLKAFSDYLLHRQLKSYEEIEYISEIDKIIDFLTFNFWNLNISKINACVILCSLITETFFDFVKEGIKRKCEYNIDLSEYLLDIEGIIDLDSSELFNKIKYLFNINKSHPLDALKNGEININNDIKDIFPFVEHFYTYKNELESLYELTSVISFYDSFIFFPTKDSKIKIDGRKDSETELTDSEIKEYFSLYNWNCLCFNDHKNIQYGHQKCITFKLSKDFEYNIYNKEYVYKMLSNSLGYSPSCFIKLEGVNTNMLNNIAYCNLGELLLRNDIEREYWLKYTRINLYGLQENPLFFSFFEFKNILIKISNPLIKPDSSRKEIISSSSDILQKAISICIYLWIYNHIKNNKEAIKTTEYLKKLILQEWDNSVGGLLRIEKKPI